MYQMEVMFGKIKDATGVAESHVSGSGQHRSQRRFLFPYRRPLLPAPPPAQLSTPPALTSFPSADFFGMSVLGVLSARFCFSDHHCVE